MTLFYLLSVAACRWLLPFAACCPPLKTINRAAVQFARRNKKKINLSSVAGSSHCQLLNLTKNKEIPHSRARANKIFYSASLSASEASTANRNCFDNNLRSRNAPQSNNNVPKVCYWILNINISARYSLDTATTWRQRPAPLDFSLALGFGFSYFFFFFLVLSFWFFRARTFWL